MDRAMLFRIKQLNDTIQNKVDKIDYLRSQVEGSAIRYKQDIIQSSGSQDLLESVIAQVIDLEDEVNELIEELVFCKRVVTKYINKLDRESHREVLYERYVLCLKIREIAESQGKSERWIKQKHKEALCLFDNLT